jgi:hypothetical protein
MPSQRFTVRVLIILLNWCLSAALLGVLGVLASVRQPFSATDLVWLSRASPDRTSYQANFAAGFLPFLSNGLFPFI